MKARRLRDALWMLSGVALLTGALGWRLALYEPALAIRPLPPSEPWLRHASLDSLQTISERIVSHDPFRLDHHPAAVPYRPELDGVVTAPPPPPPKPPKPRLALAGILGGPPWTALLDSVPGREGSVLVHKGDTLGGLRIRAVGRDTVIVQGADTVWKLVVRRPWR